MKTAIYLILILIFACSSQDDKLQEQALMILNDDCEFINVNLGKEGECKFEIYKNLVPLQLSMFNEKILEFDTYKDIDPNEKFEFLNLYDFKNSTQQEVSNNFSKHYSHKLNGYIVVFSKRDDRLFSCEIFASDHNEFSYTRTLFGSSIQYLFETDEFNDQILRSCRILVHNN